MLTEPKTAFAGVTLEISFARFRASMATFMVVRVLSRPLDRWDFGAIAELVVWGEKWAREGRPRP